MKTGFTAVLVLFCLSAVYGQEVVFLHHSTGYWLYDQGNVSDWINDYNLTNQTNYQITERFYPDTPYPWANYPYDYWNLWINDECDNSDPDIECLDKLSQDYDVIIFKHCFPGAQVLADEGNPSISSSTKSLENYKLQYRALRSLMDSYPDNKFIVWTLVPLHRLDTNAGNAARARDFVDWVKTTWLAEDGLSHPNIYLFDFFGYAAESNSNPENGQVNCLKYEYEKSHTDQDSHPNELANQTIGPIFAEFIVNTIESSSSSVELFTSELSIYPNPSDGKLIIDIDNEAGEFTLEIISVTGSVELQNNIYMSGEPMPLDFDDYASGIYFIRLYNDENLFEGKLSLD